MDRLDDQMDPELKHKLDLLQEVPPRKRSDVTRGKALFLNQAVKLASQPVSGAQKMRRKKWLAKIPNALNTGKERLPVMGTITAIVLALALLLGGTGGTVYASQSSLPGELLYPVKTLSEDVRNEITIDPQASIDLNLDLADRRVAEMVALDEEGEPLLESVVLRLQQHLNNALLQSSNLDGEAFETALLELQSRLETQEQSMLQINMNEEPQGDVLRTMTQDMIRDRLRLIEDCDGDPVLLKQQLQDRQRLNEDAAGNRPEEVPGVGNQFGRDETTDEDDGTVTDESVDSEDTTTGSGYGQGAGAGSGDQDGTDDGMQYGQDGQGQSLQTTPGTCLNSTCTVTPVPRGSGSGQGNGNGKGK